MGISVGGDGEGSMGPTLRGARRMVAAALIGIGVLMAPSPGSAQSAAPSWREALLELGHGANHVIFNLNGSLARGWRSLTGTIPSSPGGAAFGTAANNLLLNWINEPLTVMGYAAAGRFEQAGVSGRRFLVNTFRGWGGIEDRASAEGLVVPRIDFGLAMCAMGVPDGPYVVIPIVGPRTLRDGFADLVVTNVVFLVALIPVIGPTPSLETLAMITAVDEVVNLAVARQIDSIPTERLGTSDYDSVRAEYLAARAARCEALRAMR